MGFLSTLFGSSDSLLRKDESSVAYVVQDPSGRIILITHDIESADGVCSDIPDAAVRPVALRYLGKGLQRQVVYREIERP